MLFEDYHTYLNTWSIEKIVNYFNHLNIKINDKKYEDFVFYNDEKEIFKLDVTPNGLKSVSKSEDNKFIFNSFDKDIKIHNYLVNEIFISNNDSKIEKTNINITLKQENENPKIIKTSNYQTQESKEVEDFYKKSDF
jgi:hypothetical protein